MHGNHASEGAGVNIGFNRGDPEQKISATYEELKAVMLLVRSYCLVWSKPSLPWLRCGEKAHPLFLISLTDLYSHHDAVIQ